MLVFGANIKQIATGDAIGTVIEHMQTIAAPDDHQLTKIMRMFGKHILRIAIGDSDGLSGIRKEVIF